MPLLRLASLIASLGLLTSMAEARPNLDPAHLGRLAAYDVVVFSDPHRNGIERGKAIGIFDATPEEVFRTASDYAKWKDYLPRVRASRVVSAEGHQAVVEMTAELPWPAGSTRVEARYIQDQPGADIYRIRFDLIEGSMKQYLGSIYIEPWTAARDKTAVTYELVAEPDILAPKSAVNKLIRRSASGFVHALRQRINQLHQLGFLHPLQAPPPPGPRLVPPLDASSVKAKLQR
jgi:ribosome-associated toxin RatA of RatAB toxin-antitoxin module